MRTARSMHTHPAARPLLSLTLLGTSVLAGCQADSFFDPSKTGRYDPMPTVVPILSRIDTIEPEPEARYSQVTAADLVPNDLSYRLTPGDFVTVQIYELYRPLEWWISPRRIDAGGNFRVPEIGDVPAAGLTLQEFEDRVIELLQRDIMPNPIVDVALDEGTGFTYTVYGEVNGTGQYQLRDPDLRLLQALALAGGAPIGTEKVYVIRTVSLVDEITPAFKRRPPGGGQEGGDQPPVDIEELINRLPGSDRGDNSGGGGGSDDGIRPGALPQDGMQDPPVDIDALEPVQVGQPPVVDVDDLRERARQQALEQGQWVYDQRRGEWVRVQSSGVGGGEEALDGGDPPSIVERIIEIEYEQLEAGDASLNVVVRPDDAIFVKGPPRGLVYIDGEIARPGTYQLSQLGELTLNRLVATAGGLNGLAVPNKVDLVRVVGPNRQAIVRLDLDAIRQGTEPDVVLKRDDLVIIGTNWGATPLAVIRNGFRMTYGFGFLLDRNFGNDVFGAPPTRIQGQ